jgi:hypothetical protein
MRPRREFNDEDRKWIIENYPHLTNREAREHLQCGYDKLKAWVIACGYEYKGARLPDKSKQVVKVKSQWRDEDACGGYCMECVHYKTGGECRKTGRSVGALWQKRCFVEGKFVPLIVEGASTRRCKVCGEVKHFTEFWKHPRARTFTNLCQACASEMMRHNAMASHRGEQQGRESNPPHS